LKIKYHSTQAYLTTERSWGKRKSMKSQISSLERWLRVSKTILKDQFQIVIICKPINKLYTDHRKPKFYREN
jgi:hypothetical protein